MSVEISRETVARLADEARRLGISVDALLARLAAERPTPTRSTPTRPAPPGGPLPVWHLGAMNGLHRRDIYSDVD